MERPVAGLNENTVITLRYVALSADSDHVTRPLGLTARFSGVPLCWWLGTHPLQSMLW